MAALGQGNLFSPVRRAVCDEKRAPPAREGGFAACLERWRCCFQIGGFMKRLLLLALSFLTLAPMGFGVDREIIQLQQTVAMLQGEVRELQRSFDEKMAVMQTLLTQSNDKVTQLNGQLNTKLSSELAELQKSVQTSTANAGQKVDNLNGQIQGLQSSLDELRARLDKISEQMAKLASASQTIPATGGGSAPMTGSPSGFPGSSGGFSQPTPDVLYNSALRDYTGGNYPLALQEFADYLRYYPGTTLASNAQFYIGDVYYQQGQFQKAIQEYDKAIEQYPNGNKAAAAQLKKGYALINLDLRAQGARELNSLLKRFPNTPEASLAKDKLANLGPEKPAPKPRRRTAGQ